MTREEAITALGDRTQLLWGMPKVNKEYYSEALDMAISALSENRGEPIYYPPCIDCNKKMDEIRRTYDKLKELPSVENKGEWIPVTERLPKAYQKVLVTYEEIHWANEPTTYGVELISFGGVADFIAWMPLPEPYKVESEE